MKGTYDNTNYIFTIKYFHKKKDGNGYEMWGGQEDYNSCDGLTIGELFQHQKQKASEYTWYSCDGLVLLGTSIDTFGKLRVAEILAKIHIGEEDLYSSTIEYALGKKMISKYSTLNERSKRMVLTFLERYVTDYQQVREFAQTGKNILEEVDPLFGISAQGTARPMSK